MTNVKFDFSQALRSCIRMRAIQSLSVFGLLIVSMLTLSAQNLNTTLQGQWHGNTGTDDFRAGVRYNDIWGYTHDTGHEYAVIGTPKRIIFLNITDPTNPTLKNEFTGGSSTIWRDFKTYRRYTYAVADEGNEGLIIFDMACLPNGDIEKVYQSNSDFQRAHNIYIDVPNGRLYVAGSNTQNGGLIIYDLTADPANPTLLGSISLGHYVHDVFVTNNIAYCSAGNPGFFIYDLTTISNNPTAVGSVNTGSYNHSSWIFEDGSKMIYAEEVEGRPLGIIDINNPSNPSITSTFAHPLENASGLVYHNPFVLGQYAIVSSYMDGITIMDISNADTNIPTLAGYYDTEPSNNDYNPSMDGAWGTYPYFPSGNIVGSDILTGLYVISTSLPLASVNDECNNGIQDRFEEGIDCGGFCKPCGDLCGDGVMNGCETGIDCGGINCPPCAPTCTDGMMNGDETGVDCGGPDCPACPTCTDGMMNGDETGVDCGGANCPNCPGTCTDGILNQDETGIDCGGANCPPCPSCINVRLTLSLDQYPNETSWNITDANGTQIDNGGGYLNDDAFTTFTYDYCLEPGCYTFNIADTYQDGICCGYGNGSYTVNNQDAGTTFFTGGEFNASTSENFCVTAPVTCTDGIMNGDETGIDCGGTNCPACPTCTDGIMNGDETAIDCGGSTCPACPDPCPPTDTHSSNIASGTYNASQTQFASGTVQNGSVVNLHAGNCIELQTGFEVAANAEFLASIENCPSSITNTNDNFLNNNNTEGFHIHTLGNQSRALVSLYLNKAQQIELTFEGQESICMKKEAGYTRFYINKNTLAKGTHQVVLTTGDRQYIQSIEN